MHIQRPISVGPAAGPTATQGVTLGEGGGGAAAPGEGLRADWEVRMNVSHKNGFVGGAGRLLIHNERPLEDLTELILFLPGATQQGHVPTTLQVLGATVCSAKPGIPAISGQPLVVGGSGARVVITLPILNAQDWIYVDLTWNGSFPTSGDGFVGHAIPLGRFHPQMAVDVNQNGVRGVYAIPARYHVNLTGDVGTVVHLETESSEYSVTTTTAPDGSSTEHDFRSYGKASILASLLPTGSMPMSQGAPVPSAPIFP